MQHPGPNWHPNPAMAAHQMYQLQQLMGKGYQNGPGMARGPSFRSLPDNGLHQMARGTMQGSCQRFPRDYPMVGPGPGFYPAQRPPMPYAGYNRFRMMQQYHDGPADGARFNNGASVNNPLLTPNNVVGEIRAGMAAAACAAAAAVQRAQLLQDGERREDVMIPPSGGENLGEKEDDGSATVVSQENNKKDPQGEQEEASGDADDLDKDQEAKSSGESRPGSLRRSSEEGKEEERAAAAAEAQVCSSERASNVDQRKETVDQSANDGETKKEGMMAAAPTSGDGGTQEQQLHTLTSTASSSSLGDTTSTRADVVRQPSPTSDSVITSSALPDTTSEKPNTFLRDFLQSKLAFAAAVAHRPPRPPFVPPAPHRGLFPSLIRAPFVPPPSYPGYLPPRFHPAMEPALLANGGVSPREFNARGHNNNDLKDPNLAAANFMSQFLKMRQEMAMNMNNQQSDDSPRSGTDEDNKLEDEEEPIDLQKDGRSSVHSSTDAELNLPRSPSSDAGMSSSSAGEKGHKTSRLEQIVSSMRNSSPLPSGANSQTGSVNGCKKRKLYQPVQHEKSPQSPKGDEDEEESKKRKPNDENEDPAKEEEEPSVHVPRQRAKQVRDSTKVQHKDLTSSPSLPFLAGNAVNPLQAQYMEMARRFLLQEQQDKITKEAITKEILNDTISKNSDIASKLVAISPELQGLADILKTEITASLAIIIDSIVGRFSASQTHAARRQQTLQSGRFGRPGRRRGFHVSGQRVFADARRRRRLEPAPAAHPPTAVDARGKGAAGERSVRTSRDQQPSHVHVRHLAFRALPVQFRNRVAPAPLSKTGPRSEKRRLEARHLGRRQRPAGARRSPQFGGGAQEEAPQGHRLPHHAPGHVQGLGRRRHGL